MHYGVRVRRLTAWPWGNTSNLIILFIIEIFKSFIYLLQIYENALIYNIFSKILSKSIVKTRKLGYTYIVICFFVGL